VSQKRPVYGAGNPRLSVSRRPHCGPRTSTARR